MDALAESYQNYSPYNYVLGNPINFIDPDGNKVKESDSGYFYNGNDARWLFQQLKRDYGSEEEECPGDPPSGLSLPFGTLGSGITFYNGALRIDYMYQTYRLKSLYETSGVNFKNIRIGYNQRFRLKSTARKSMKFSRNLAKVLDNHPSTKNSLRSYTLGDKPSRFYRTDLKWNLTGGAGLAIGTAGLIYSGYNIVNVENPYNQSIIEVGSFAGAWAGAEFGASIGGYVGGPWEVLQGV